MPVNLKYFLILLYISLTSIVHGQKAADIPFINHLSEKGMYKAVIHLTSTLDYKQYALPEKDSLYYLSGWSHYATKQLQRSSALLSMVSPSSPLYEKSHFFSAYNHSYLGQYQQAFKQLNGIKIEREKLHHLRYFQKAGISLLQRNYQQFDDYIQQTDTIYYAISEESQQLKQYAQELRTHQRKSPWLAGIMSAIVPGSGKIYAGKTGEGISAFITVGGLGLVTFENYYKNGLNDIKTIFFGALFTTFYIGNIYGTVFTVKISENAYQKTHNHNILFSLHMPLRTVFN